MPALLLALPSITELIHFAIYLVVAAVVVGLIVWLLAKTKVPPFVVTAVYVIAGLAFLHAVLRLFGIA